jgi:hypothetical protein
VIDTGTVSVEARNEICIGLPDSQMLWVTVLVCTNVYSVGHVSVQTEACGYVAAAYRILGSTRPSVCAHLSACILGVVGVIHQVGESWSLSRMKRSSTTGDLPRQHRG